jgi:hypothetical protein
MSTSRRLPTATATLLATLAIVAGCTSPATSPAPSAAATSGPTGNPAACAQAPEPASVDAWTGANDSANLSVIPVAISGDLACGLNRFLFSFVDSNNNVLASPDREASVAFYDLGRDTEVPVIQTASRFIWAIEDVRGIYETDVEFPEAGVWGAEFHFAPKAGGDGSTVRVAFEVLKDGRVKGVGDAAPSDATLTLADVGGDIRKLSTDTAPVADFYKVSIKQALVDHKPFLVAFATPKFCATGQCGPTLDRVKPFLAQYPTVTFINVEPYQLEWKDDQLQPVMTQGGLTPVQATLDWGLISEPWVFVVDRDGIITASFEGVFADSELKLALDKVK